MKNNLIQRIAFETALGIAGLAGCATAPSNISKETDYETPKEESIPKEAQKKSEWEVTLRNGYRLESKIGEKDLGIIAGIINKTIKVTRLENGKYKLNGSVVDEISEPELYREICRILDRDKDNSLSDFEVMSGLEVVYRNATENR